MKKKITRKGYRTLAVIWTLAAASMAVAFMRRLAEFNLFLLLMMVLSLITAVNFWKAWKETAEGEEGEEMPRDPFPDPPRFSDSPVLFEDDPNQDSEEKKHE